MGKVLWADMMDDDPDEPSPPPLATVSKHGVKIKPPDKTKPPVPVKKT